MDLRTRMHPRSKQPCTQQQRQKEQQTQMQNQMTIKQSEPPRRDDFQVPYRRDRITEDLLLDEGTLLQIQSLTGRELQRKMALLRELKSEYKALYEENLQIKRETLDMLETHRAAQHRKSRGTTTTTAYEPETNII